jgi:hypothetical protein
MVQKKNPDGVRIFHLHNPSGRTMVLGSTQPMTEMSIPGMFPEGRCVGMTTLPPSCADSLKILEPQPSGTAKACNGIAFTTLITKFQKLETYITFKFHT